VVDPPDVDLPVLPDAVDLVDVAEGDLCQDVDPECLAVQCLVNLLSSSINKHATLLVLPPHKGQECNNLLHSP
jgi:hypothetical protein